MDNERIDKIIDKYHGDASYLIQVLLDIQAENSWLPREALGRVAEKLQVPMTRIQHIATFYKAFSLVPKGRHQVHICMGTACHVRGASRVLDTVEEITGIKPGETDLERNSAWRSSTAWAAAPWVPSWRSTGRHTARCPLSRRPTY